METAKKFTIKNLQNHEQFFTKPMIYRPHNISLPTSHHHLTTSFCPWILCCIQCALTATAAFVHASYTTASQLIKTASREFSDFSHRSAPSSVLVSTSYALLHNPFA